MLQLDCSEPKMSSKEAIEALAKTAVKVIRGDVIGTAFGFYDAYKAYVPKDPSREQMAFLFWQAAFFLAVTDALTRNRLARMTDEKVIGHNTAWLLKTVFDPSDPGEFELSHVVDPTEWGLYREKLRARFPDFVASLEEAHSGFTDDELMHQLDISLRASLQKVWTESRFADFQLYIASLRDDPVYESLMRRRQWQQHYAWIEDKLSGSTLFGQEDGSGVTVRSVYTPLRCAWEIVEDLPVEDRDLVAQDTGQDPSAQRKRIVHVDHAEQALKSWVYSVAGSGSTDTLRVIAGGPGSGKTTLVQMLASELAQEGLVNVCFIELQHFVFNGDLRSSITSEMKLVRDGVGVGGDPVQWQDSDDARPLLFIFDGLDEFVGGKGVKRGIAHEFFENVREFLRTLNRGKARVLAILTGRHGSVSDAMDSKGTDTHALLEVMPLTPLQEHAFFRARPGRFALQEIIDPNELLNCDHRKLFWENWCKGSGQENMQSPGALEVKELDDFTGEPLLFYLLVLTGYAMDPRQVIENKNDIYQSIFQEVYERDFAKRDEREDELISQDQFFLLMECLGIAVWQGGGRVGSEEAFKTILDWHTGLEASNFASLSASSLNNVALQFYTRHTGDGSEPGFEFIHKSFGEYLAGRALLRIGEALSALNRKKDEIALQWVTCTGPAHVSLEILEFLVLEMARRPPDQLKGLIKRLSKQVSWAVENGMPAHLLPDIGTWQDAETRQRNATGALLAVLNAAYRVRRSKGECPPIRVKWTDEFSARRFLERLHLASPYHRAFRQLLSGIDFAVKGKTGEESTPPYLRTMLLIRTDLQGACLRHARLFETSLAEADLTGADLESADLRGAILQAAHLQETNLANAHLEKANAAFAVLRDANLKNAILRKADLSFAVLKGADLQGTDLEDAVLSRADLQGANLTKTKLRGANLSHAKLQGADLKHQKLRDVNLQGAQLNKADLFEANLQELFMYSADLREAHLHRAKLQEANLRSADLRAADLRDADCQESDLSDAKLKSANLKGAKLKRANLARANLEDTNLQQAILSDASLQNVNARNADLREANLQLADLHGVDLQGADVGEASFDLANLSSTNLADAKNLSQHQLESAFGDRVTAASLPEGLQAPDHWANEALDGFEAHAAWSRWKTRLFT